MDNQDFTAIANIIKFRRNIKPGLMNGQKIPNGHVAALLELADWAPTHAFTEPWRFVVYEDPQAFCAQHAELYKQQSTPETFNPASYNNFAQMGNKASHVIVAYMHRSELSKLPVMEEIAATACAMQNLLLGAAALNIGVHWATGGAALKPVMKEFLGAGEHDQVMGILYLGYADEHPEGVRKVPLEEKVKWIK